MLRRIPMYLLLATFVTSSSALAARTTEHAQAGAKKTATPPAKKTATPPAKKTAAPAPAPVAAKGASAPVTPADVAELMGTWQIPLETPTGRLVANLVFRTEAGKVVAGVSAPQFKEHKITDITKSGQVVTLKASTDYSGPLTAYSGPVKMVLTLRPKGPDLAAWFDFNDTGFQLGGTAKKKI